MKTFYSSSVAIDPAIIEIIPSRFDLLGFKSMFSGCTMVLLA